MRPNEGVGVDLLTEEGEVCSERRGVAVGMRTGTKGDRGPWQALCAHFRRACWSMCSSTTWCGSVTTKPLFSRIVSQMIS